MTMITNTFCHVVGICAELHYTLNIEFNGGHPVVRHNTIIYKYLRQYTTILVTNATLFCSWRHVSGSHIWCNIIRYYSNVSWPEDGCLISRNMSPRTKYSCISNKNSCVLT